MKINKAFRRLDLGECEKLYKPNHNGVLHFKEALDPKFLTLLRKETLSFEEKFKRTIATAVTEVKHLNANLSIYRSTKEDFPMCMLLTRDYNKLVYSVISEHIGFHEQGKLDIEINMYPGKTGQLGYHQDNTNEINLIGAVSVSGPGTFSVAKWKKEGGYKEYSFTVNPGDMVLIRAHLWPKTHPDIRPLHKVTTLMEDRYSVLIRHKASQQAN